MNSNIPHEALRGLGENSSRNVLIKRRVRILQGGPTQSKDLV